MVSAMPKRSNKLTDSSGRHEIPRWRRIEILREKAQLREALGDLDFDEDFSEYDKEVFGSDEEYLSFHEHSEVDDEVFIDTNDDELIDDDFEDFEDD
jgi:hypothetical protein